MKFGMYIIGIWAPLKDVLHKSLPSVCVSVCVLPYRCYATSRWKRSSGNEYTHDNRIVGGGGVLYAVCSSQNLFTLFFFTSFSSFVARLISSYFQRLSLPLFIISSPPRSCAPFASCPQLAPKPALPLIAQPPQGLIKNCSIHTA
jgi:hypothetical protein